MNIPGLIEASAAEMGSADMFKNILLVRAGAPDMRNKLEEPLPTLRRLALIRSNNIIYSTAGTPEGEIGPETFLTR